MTLRELRSGDAADTAMTRGEYYELRDSDPRPWPEPVNRLLQAIADVPDDDWRRHAACHPDNRDRPLAEWVGIWYSENGDTYTQARTICAACPVAGPCQEDGASEKYGMWAGQNAEERTLARNPNMPPMTRHGYPFGAQAHRRRGEQPCDECMEVQRRYEVAYRARRKARRDAA